MKGRGQALNKEISDTNKKSAVANKVSRIELLYPLHGEKFTVREPVAPQLRSAGLQTAEKLGCSPRLERLRLRYSANKPTICTHRARTYTAVYRETEARLAALSWRWQSLDPLVDIDRPEDLVHLEGLDFEQR